MLKFHKLIFFFTMMVGTLITISSYSWMSMWMGLEINLLSIIPLLKSNNNNFPAEAALKYFIIQSVASTMFLFSMTLNFSFNEQISMFNKIFNNIFLISIFTKMGMAPFHAWFPEVMEGLSWNKGLLMLTWQKIAPMIIVMQNFKLSFMIISMIIISAFLSSSLGLNQISMRKIMVYSSINHTSWMISSLTSVKVIWLMYFTMYSIMTMIILLTLKSMKIYYFHQIKFSNYKAGNLLMSLNFLSLAGLPPFIGFFPKWLTINFLINSKMYFLSLMIILFTLIFLYIYTRIMFSSMTMLKMEFMKNYNKNKNFIIYLNFMLLFSILFVPSIFNYI